MILVTGFTNGVGPNEGVQLLTALGIGWAIAFFCALDARAHQQVFPHSFWLLTFLTWPVMPLVCLIRARGKRGALDYVLYAALLSFCYFTSNAIGSLLEK